MEQLYNTQLVSDIQGRQSVSGSRFAVFDMEEATLEEEGMMDEQREHMGDESTTPLINLRKDHGIIISDNEEINQENNIVNMEAQQDNNHSIGQESNLSMLKRKNIMEKFIRAKGKEKNTNTSTLKANSVGIFKSQKPKKLSDQWEKAKSLMNTMEITKPILLQEKDHRETVNSKLNAKPPDINALLSKMENTVMEGQQGEDSYRGIDPSGK